MYKGNSNLRYMLVRARVFSTKENALQKLCLSARHAKYELALLLRSLRTQYCNKGVTPLLKHHFVLCTRLFVQRKEPCYMD